MESKHTPGPWHVGKRFSGGAVYAAKGEEICAFSDLIPPVECLANKRLIAAAPELLAALKGAQKALRNALPFCPPDGAAHHVGEWLDEVGAAIAKAEGRE